ncbi:CARDB domain-containing protein, partial [Hyalangium versicolor]|uniref:CARDB domain-containing protein n=1 Tax=Hyalangium versicolor TaxID=2861190 RepID=UPI0028168887
MLLLGVVGCGAPEGTPEGRSGAKVSLQGLSTAPDFVVTKVTAPASSMPENSFQTTVEVCNRGGTGSGTDVNLYFSDDDVITPDDFWAETLYVGYLSPGQCESQSVWLTASVPTPGPWYVGAYADPYGSQLESDEGNNGLASPVMGIGMGADFVVTSVKGPASAESGQYITTQVTVCNRGTQGGSVDVEVYLSADEFIHPNTSPGVSEDSYVGSAFSEYLTPGQCRTVPVSGSAQSPEPGSEGAYYVGAVADPHEGRPELIEDNNALAGYRMGVGYGPDFVITSVTGSASAEEGQRMTAQVTVCNRGTRGSYTDVEVYLSADDVINFDTSPGPGEDSYVGSAYIDYLSPGRCTTVPVEGNVSLPAPGFEGPYYVGAVADPHGNREELIEDNNTLAGYRMGVGYGPDFVVTSVTGPAGAESGQHIITQVTVCNRGTRVRYAEVAVYLSTDADIRASVTPDPAGDSMLGSAPIDYLAPGQ